MIGAIHLACQVAVEGQDDVDRNVRLLVLKLLEGDALQHKAGADLIR